MEIVKNLDYNTSLILFYIFIAVIFLIILNCFAIFVVSYNNNKRSLETSHMLFIIFRIYFELLQILYLPFISVFFFVLDCQNINGLIVHSTFNNVECFAGNNLIHFFVSIIGIILFITSSFIFIKFSFEVKSKSSSWNAK